MLHSPPADSLGHFHSGLHKRKATIDEIFEVKRSHSSINALKKEFVELMEKKRAFLMQQRRSSLLVDARIIDDNSIMNQFADFYRKVSNTPMAPSDHRTQIELIQQTIKESIIVEWPRTVFGLGSCGDEDTVEVDSAPLIHRARNVVKCRTSHPSMRVKVFAIGKSSDQPKTVEAFFRATLVKITLDGQEPRQVVGKVILTQREGTPATKSADQNGAIVNSEGQLVASQAAPETHTYILLDRFAEPNAKTTGFKFENGVLCATFPEMGVTLNSMVDRRQLATRYAMQVEVAVNIDNKLIIQHSILSQPFLIAITNDQTEPLLLSIFWHRLLNTDLPDPVDPTIDLPPLKWGIIKQAITHFVKAQHSAARSLHRSELLHIQCMLLLPRILHCVSASASERMELALYGSVREQRCTEESTVVKMRNRLLEEEILDEVLIDKRELITDYCYSILDMQTQLRHSVWQWLYKATELIIDVGHKMCPSPVFGEKKGVKTKKQMIASEEYQTMAGLFNKGLISFTSAPGALSILSDISRSPRLLSSESEARAILLRFCDENAGYISLAYTANEGKPIFGSISGDQIKDFKQGLPEVLLDEQYPSKFDKLVRLEFKQNICDPTISLIRKKSVFHSYRTMRMQNESIHVMDELTHRVNPLTGDELQRVRLAPSPEEEDHFAQISQHLPPPLRHSDSMNAGSLPTSSPQVLLDSSATLLSILQQQLSPMFAMSPFVTMASTAPESSPPNLMSTASLTPPQGVDMAQVLQPPLVSLFQQQNQLQQFLRMQGIPEICFPDAQQRCSSTSSGGVGSGSSENEQTFEGQHNEEMDTTGEEMLSPEERDEKRSPVKTPTTLEQIIQQTMDTRRL